MDRDVNEDILDLIDLGIATIETQGGGIKVLDFAGLQNTAMISDD